MAPGVLYRCSCYNSYLGELEREADGSSCRLCRHLWHLRGRHEWQLWSLQSEVLLLSSLIC